MDNWAAIVFCILAIPFGIGWFIGYLHRGAVEHGKWKRGEYTLPPAATSPTLDADRDEIVRTFLHRPDVVHAIGGDRWSALLGLIAAPESARGRANLSTPSPVAPVEDAGAAPREEIEAPPAFDEPTTTPPPIVVPDEMPATTPPRPVTLRLPLPREEEEGTRLEPAVLLLYLGALLIVAAGVIFASYAWGTLSAWQKMGLLLAGTTAFLGAGYGFRNASRIAQAAETFLAIGALLIPANIIAAYAVFEGEITNRAIPLCIGAAVIAIVYTVFSLDPGGALYRFGAPIAAFVAIGATPAAFGFEPTWAAAAMLVVFAIVPTIGGRLRHLGDVWTLVGWIGCSIAILWMIGEALTDYADGFHHLPWTIGVTAAILTATLLRRWIATADDTWAIIATVTGIIATGALMMSADIEDNRIWTAAATVIALVFVALADALRHESTRGALAVTLLVESLLGFSFATAVILDGDPAAGVVSLVFAVPMLAYIWTAFRRLERWWLLVSAITSVGVVFPLLDLVLPDADENTAVPLIIAGYVALLGAAAIATSIAAARRGHDSDFALPVWVWAGIVAWGVIGIQATEFTDDTGALAPRMALTGLLFALLSLVAAWSLTMVAARAISGLFAATAVLALAWWPDMRIEDRFPLILLLSLVAAAPVVPPFASRLRAFPPLAVPQPPIELAVHGVVAAGSILAISGSTAIHIGAPDRASAPGFWWTWAVALIVFLAMAAIGAVIGLRDIELPSELERWLPEWTLAWTGYATLFATTLITRDVQILTWIGLTIAGAMAIVPARDLGNTYLTNLLARTRIAGLAIGILAIVVNLQASSVRYDDRDIAQTVIYAGIALVLIAFAARPEQRIVLWGGLLAAGLAIAFGLRATDATLAEAALVAMAIGWVMYGAMLALPESRHWQRDSWVIAAAIAAIGGMLFAYTANDADTAFGQTMLVLSIANVGLLLAVEGRRRGMVQLIYAGSGFGMMAVFTALQVRDVTNVHAYSLPLAAYAFALAWFLRREPGTRDLLTALGSVALVGPPILFALLDQSFMWLAVTLVEAVVLVVGGAIVRLRVAIAIGIAAVTLIVLRLLVDAANALPGWATLLVLGLLLLGAGTIWITLRDDIRDRSETLRDRWKSLA